MPFQRVSSLSRPQAALRLPGCCAAKLYLEGRSQQEIAAILRIQNVEVVEGFIRDFAKVVRLAIQWHSDRLTWGPCHT